MLLRTPRYYKDLHRKAMEDLRLERIAYTNDALALKAGVRDREKSISDLSARATALYKDNVNLRKEQESLRNGFVALAKRLTSRRSDKAITELVNKILLDEEDFYRFLEAGALGQVIQDREANLPPVPDNPEEPEPEDTYNEEEVPPDEEYAYEPRVLPTE